MIKWKHWKSNTLQPILHNLGNLNSNQFTHMCQKQKIRYDSNWRLDRSIKDFALCYGSKFDMFLQHNIWWWWPHMHSLIKYCFIGAIRNVIWCVIYYFYVFCPSFVVECSRSCLEDGTSQKQMYFKLPHECVSYLAYNRY